MKQKKISKSNEQVSKSVNQTISVETIQNVSNSINEKLKDHKHKSNAKEEIKNKTKTETIKNKKKFYYYKFKNKKFKVKLEKREEEKKKEEAIQNNENQKNAALQYLQMWKDNLAEWKFRKIQQNWLFKFYFDKKQIPKKYLPILLEYASQSQGLARQRLINQAKSIIKKAEENTEEALNNTEEETNISSLIKKKKKKNNTEEVTNNTEKETNLKQFEEATNKTEDENSNKLSKTRLKRARTLIQTIED